VHTYAFTHTYTCTHVRMLAHPLHTHTPTHTRTHTHTHTHAHTPGSTMQQQLAHLSLREQHLAQQLHQPASSALNGQTNTHTHTPAPNGHTTHTNTRTPTSNGPAQPSVEQEVQVMADVGLAANSVQAAFNGLQVRISSPPPSPPPPPHLSFSLHPSPPFVFTLLSPVLAFALFLL